MSDVAHLTAMPIELSITLTTQSMDLDYSMVIGLLLSQHPSLET
jgi:hypothetical protein